MNKFFNGKFALLAFAFLMMFFNSTIFAQSKTEVLIVADRRADCTGVSKMRCLQVKKPQDEQWSSFYQTIENFDYREGYTYIVRVRVDSFKNPAADGSNLRYTLRKILHRERTADENSGANQSSNDADLAADWKLTAVDGAAVDAPKASIRFDVNKKAVGGNGGCNVFGGNLERNGSQIKISQVFSTKMYCEGASEIENKFLGNLERATSYQIKGGKLLLLAGEKIILQFERKS